MPDRIVRADILTSDAVNALSWPAEIFYRRLMSIADDFGRSEGRPSILRASLYPLKLDRVSEPDVVKWMNECSEAGLVRLYTVKGKEYLVIQKFGQRLRAMKSKYPAPEDADLCQQATASDSRPRPETKRNESENEGEEKPPPPLLPDGKLILVSYNAEETVLKNPIRFEQLCMRLNIQQPFARDSLRKFHLHLAAEEKYPKGAEACFAGFEKWLMNEKHFSKPEQSQSNGTSIIQQQREAEEKKRRDQLNAAFAAKR